MKWSKFRAKHSVKPRCLDLKKLDPKLVESLEELNVALMRRVVTGPSDLPSPNQDIQLRATVGRSKEAIGDLGWTNAEFLPVAEINDGDLLVVALAVAENPIYAYFHDGGDFDMLYSSIAAGLQALRHID